MNSERLKEVLTPILAQFDLDLDAVEVIPAGKRSVVRIIVDGDGPAGKGPLLDDIAEATKAISIELDSSDVTGNGPYTLEVSSRGVSRPLTLPRHWRRNHDRLVAVTLAEGQTVTGRIAESDEERVTLDVDGAEQIIAYAEVTKALVQVELNRKTEEED